MPAAQPDAAGGSIALAVPAVSPPGPAALRCDEMVRRRAVQ